jgi:aarF domain-containing kinase
LQHPGNLLRTPDGRICILDFGLVSEVAFEQRIHLVEFIAHLSLEDWDAVTADLIALGFLPSDTTTANVEVIAPVIKEVRSLHRNS